MGRAIAHALICTMPLQQPRFTVRIIDNPTHQQLPVGYVTVHRLSRPGGDVLVVSCGWRISKQRAAVLADSFLIDRKRFVEVFCV